jgi:two-component system, NtrC family, sensor kinase
MGDTVADSSVILASEDVALHHGLHQALTRRGIDLRMVRSGWGFVAAARHPLPDLMLLDHWLPDMLGDEVIEQLRRQAALRDTPIILVAPGITNEARVRCEQLGPVRVFTEPPLPDELLAEVFNKLLMRQRRQMRVALRLPVELCAGDQRAPATTRDLSVAGASLETQLQVESGEHVEVAFVVDPDKFAAAHAIVRRVEGSAGTRVLGVEFLHVPSALQTFLLARTRGGQQLSEIIARLERLPALSAVVAKILGESLKEDPDLGTIISLVRSDPALASYVIRLANTAVYYFASPVTTVQRAATLMGISAVRNAVLGATVLRHISQDKRGKLATTLWQHSVASAIACELLAPRFEVEPCEAFTLGLLHDLGKFVMLSSLDEEAWLGHDPNDRFSPERERELFGMDHAEIGAAVLTRWGIPASLHQVIARHHQGAPPDAAAPLKRAVQLVRAADALVYTCHLGVANGVNDGLATLAAHVRRHELESLRARIFRELGTISSILDRPVEPAELCATLVERANERLSSELGAAEERNELLQRAYERARQQLTSVVQSEKYHALGRIAAGLSHEINNPLAYTICDVDTLERYCGALVAATKGEPPPAGVVLDEVVRELPVVLREAQDGLQRVSAIVRSLQHFVPQGPTQLEPGNLRRCVEQALELAKSSRPVGVDVQLGGAQVPDLLMDESALVRAFVEIVLNAFAAMPKGGKLRIDLRSEAEHVSTIFGDTGEGIPAENLKHLFEPFFTTRPVGSGRGLGLSVAYGAISRMGGQIVIGSTVGVGTTVEVRLPVTSASAT